MGGALWLLLVLCSVVGFGGRVGSCCCVCLGVLNGSASLVLLYGAGALSAVGWALPWLLGFLGALAALDVAFTVALLPCAACGGP